MDFSSALPTGTDTSDSTDLRTSPRFTSLIRAAKLVCGQGEFVCVIRDVSSTGVSLRCFHKLPTDYAIALELQNGESYEMKQVRKSGNEASYRFDRPVAVERLIHENWNFPKRQLRLNIAIPLTVSSLTGSAEALTLNLSQQGARLECDHVFAIDQSLKVEGEFLREIRAKVRWRRDSNYGIAFDNLFSLREFAMLAVKVQCPLLLENDLL